MISNEQADEIMIHLLNELELNGYGDIARTATAIVEDNDEDEYYPAPPYRLLNFLENFISILDAISNDKFDILISNMQEYITNEQEPIRTVYVQSAFAPEIRYDLRDLPDYAELKTELKEIFNGLGSENN